MVVSVGGILKEFLTFVSTELLGGLTWTKNYFWQMLFTNSIKSIRFMESQNYGRVQ
jgi:hypothetical protein